MRVGAGAGIQYLTPIGFISFAVGVKLNPSYLDLRPAARVYCGNDGVVFADTDTDDDTPDVATCTGGYLGARDNNTTFNPADIDPSVLARLQFHLAIGQSF
jgi:outer membrane protein insertion porin family